MKFPKSISFKTTGKAITICFLCISNLKAQTFSIFVPASAGLKQPNGIAFDKKGNLFVANSTYGNNTISKVSPTGIVSTYFSASIGLVQPGGIAFDTLGNLYASSIAYNNNTIYKITPAGVVTTFIPASAGLQQPSGLTFDKQGNLYVSNGTYGNNTISKITPSGIVSTYVPASAGLKQPGGLVFDALGNLYVTNLTYGDNTISKVSPSGIVSTFIRSSSGLQQPAGIAFDSVGNLFVSNSTYGNNTIVKFNANLLPLTNVTFNVSIKNNIVDLVWQTATEINTDHFIIQHSIDGSSFTKIGTVKAVGSGANSYAFTDYIRTIGTNYYRLQNVDKDGSSSYSKVINLNIGNGLSFAIKPNPAKDFATISLSKTVDKATIAVYDMAGNAVITQSLNGTTSYKLNTQTLTNGVYMIKVKTDTCSYNEKLLINK